MSDERVPAGGAGAITMEVNQNKYLSTHDDSGEMHAVVAVQADGLAATAAHAQAAEVIVIDCSGSMVWPPTKIAAARRATIAAVSVLRDGTRFAIVEGTESARVVYPAPGRLAVAGADTRAAAADAARGLVASGGTAIGGWLSLARSLLVEWPDALRHVLLLTDGRNEHEPPERLTEVLAACSEAFVCDARGIGDDWDAAELKAIARHLHGTADAVPRHESDLEGEFRELAGRAMTKALPEVRLRLRCRDGERPRFVKQVFPTERDLTDEGFAVADGCWEFPTRSWGDEARDFHVCVTAQPQSAAAPDPSGEDLQLAMVELVSDGDLGAALPPPVAIRVHWTDDVALSTRRHPQLDHYLGQSELGRLVNAGCDAYETGRLAVAAENWGQAVRLADTLGDTRMLGRLAKLVEIDDQPDRLAGPPRVRLRDDIQRIDWHTAQIITEDSVQWEDAGQRPTDDGAQTCPACGLLAPIGDAVCEQCGGRLPRKSASS